MKISWQRHINEIDAVFAPCPNWDFEMTQLGGGTLGYRAFAVDLPGVMITLETMEKPIRSLQLMRQKMFYAGLVLGQGAPVLWKGRDVYPNMPLIFGNLAHDTVLPAGCLVLNLQVAPDLAGPLGLMNLEPGLWHGHPARIQRFVQSCMALAQTGFAPDTGDDIAWRVLGQFLAGLDHPVCSKPSRKYDIMQRTEQLIAGQGWDEAHCIDDLAAAVGVSRRTMHRAFKDLYGIGPQGFLRLVRLHHFRHALLRGKPGSVTDAALDAGFDHFGRAAQYYHKQFGELPKQTLTRAI